MNVKHFIEEKRLIFEITEEMDHHVVEKIRKRTDYEIQRLIPKEVIFDFTKVKFMDSAGIGLILGRYKQVASLGGEMKIVNPNERIKKILEMSGVMKVVQVINLDDEEGRKIVNE